MQTLTADKTSIWHEDAELQANLSLSTMRRISKRFCGQHKPAVSVNDYCIYCHDLETKVMPQVHELVQTVRQTLTEEMAGYWDAWDAYEAANNLVECPGRRLRLLKHYVDQHSSNQPCRHHTQPDSFPCGLACLRARGSGFPQRRRVDLHLKEADAGVKLRDMSKLLDAYLFHRAANEFQKPILARLLEHPAAGTVTILSDFKEQVTLPLRAVKTGEEFYAGARREISIFGSVVAERSSDEDDSVLWTRVLIVSDILDHTCARASQCIEMALQQRRGSQTLQELNLVSDAGPHFRAYEALHHYCLEMPVKHGCRVVVNWGVEKHMKSEADRLPVLN